jgi:hypothetical protein
MSRRLKVSLAGLILMAHPLVALAEVSVQLDRQGKVRRVHVLTGSSRRGTVVWGQVRARVPLEAMLNPLGDTYGDLAPTVATDPLTGNPWAVWPRNVGNQKRIVLSIWDGKRWTAPVPVAVADPMGYDQVNPGILFDAAGVPFLVYSELSPKGRVLFTTVAREAWTPPLLLSSPQVDSREPVAAMDGENLKLGYRTPTGQVSVSFEAGRLIDSALSLMDSPIPPGSQSGPGDPQLPGGSKSGGQGGPGDEDPFLQIE